MLSLTPYHLHTHTHTHTHEQTDTHMPGHGHIPCLWDGQRCSIPTQKHMLAHKHITSHTHLYTHAHTRSHSPPPIHTHTHTHTCPDMDTYPHTHTHTHAHTYIHTGARGGTHTHAKIMFFRIVRAESMPLIAVKHPEHSSTIALLIYGAYCETDRGQSRTVTTLCDHFVPQGWGSNKVIHPSSRPFAERHSWTAERQCMKLLGSRLQASAALFLCRYVIMSFNYKGL
jgi:hypothetical protein